jgi:hypothetical protein
LGKTPFARSFPQQPGTSSILSHPRPMGKPNRNPKSTV